MNIVIHLYQYTIGNPFIFLMKKFFSILFACLILVSVMHITIATHFCGSELASSEKISVSGELASCGMEDDGDNCSLPDNHYSKHCCNDNMVVLAVDNNYELSFSEFKSVSHPSIQAFYIPSGYLKNSISFFNLIRTNVSPPGNLVVSDVSLPDICVFRI